MLYNRLEEWRREQEQTLHDKKDQPSINKGRYTVGYNPILPNLVIKKHRVKSFTYFCVPHLQNFCSVPFCRAVIWMFMKCKNVMKL